METNYLLPNKFKKLGWVLFGLGLIGGIFIYATIGLTDEFLKVKVLSVYDNQLFGDSSFFKIVENGIFDELVSVFIIVGGFFSWFYQRENRR